MQPQLREGRDLCMHYQSKASRVKKRGVFTIHTQTLQLKEDASVGPPAAVEEPERPREDYGVSMVSQLHILHLAALLCICRLPDPTITRILYTLKSQPAGTMFKMPR